MGTKCALLDADPFLFCYERVFMLSENNKADAIEVFSSSLGHLDDWLNIDIPFLNERCVRYI